jgi:hypothetical protein
MARKMYPNLTINQSPRIQFNWGFHDGAHDAVTEFTRTAGFINRHYEVGYLAGKAEVNSTGTRPDDSGKAWQSYLKCMDAEQRQATHYEQLYCEIGELENCLRRSADDSMIDKATKRANELMSI